MRPSLRNQARAVHHLVRPSEVKHLYQRDEYGRLLLPIDVTLAVSTWLKTSLGGAELLYIPDNNQYGYDTWCSPARTLYRRGGDCDDLAILVVSTLLTGRVRAKVVIGYLVNDDGWMGHAWVEGHDQYGWFLFEATNGEVYREQRPDVYVPSHQLPTRHLH
jgi:transglutaminase superfamily protein